MLKVFPLNYEGLFGSQKFFWKDLEVSFVLRWGETLYGGTWENKLQGGKDLIFKNWIVYLFFHFLNLARFHSCI